MSISTEITFVSDPGHGWALIPMAELRELGIAGEISSCSYRRGDTAALEEDCDLGLYLAARHKQGHPEPAYYERYSDPCDIRNWRNYFSE